MATSKTSQAQTINGVPAFSASSDRTKSGWTWGTGVEAALSGNWTGKIEYLYVDLGNTVRHLRRAAQSAHEIREHIFRAGVNYRFGGNSGRGCRSPPAANWSGFYLGGNGGSGLARDKKSADRLQHRSQLSTHFPNSRERLYRRRAGRLQLAGGKLGVRPRGRLPGFLAARDDRSCLRELQRDQAACSPMTRSFRGSAPCAAASAMTSARRYSMQRLVSPMAR